MRFILLLLAAAAAVAPARSIDKSAFKPMRGILLPNSDAIFKVADAAKATEKATGKAAQSRNQDAVTMSTDRLADACDSCHMVYRDKR